MTFQKRRDALRLILTGSRCIRPGSVYDAISIRIAEDLGFGDPKHGRLPGRARYVAEPARGEREPAERRFPAVPPEADRNRLGAVAARPGRTDHQRIAAAAGTGAPPFGKELGKLPEPPTKELAKHVPKPIPGFAPNRRAGMLKSR